jgi:hypothetical protein
MPVALNTCKYEASDAWQMRQGWSVGLCKAAVPRSAKGGEIDPSGPAHLHTSECGTCPQLLLYAHSSMCATHTQGLYIHLFTGHSLIHRRLKPAPTLSSGRSVNTKELMSPKNAPLFAHGAGANPPNTWVRDVSTGVFRSVSPGMRGRLCPRSSRACKMYEKHRYHRYRHFCHRPGAGGRGVQGGVE